MRHLSLRSSFIAILTITGALGAGVACSDDDDNKGTKDGIEAGTGSGGGSGAGGSGSGGGTGDSGACAFTVCPSADDHEAIQTALIEAQSGDVITLGPGTYEIDAELSLQDATNVTLRGGGTTRDDVLLDFTGQSSGAEGILVTADGFTIENLSIKNTKGNGIKVQADDSVFRNIKVGWDDTVETRGAYAVYPTGCVNTLMEDNEVYNAWDAGIYAGQCENVIARRNKAYGNVLGIEIENTTNADVYENEAYNNTCGLLLDLLPNLAKKTSSNYLVRDNIIRDNNLPNFAQTGTTAAVMPQGTGVLVLAASDMEIRDNTISGNEGVAISIVSYDIIDVLATLEGGTPAAADPGTNRWPERIHIHGNTYTNNGTNPVGAYELIADAGEGGLSLPYHVVWDGQHAPSGLGDGGAGDGGAGDGGAAPNDADVQICLGTTERTAFMNFKLSDVLNPAARSRDATPHQCTLPAIPELTP